MPHGGGRRELAPWEDPGFMRVSLLLGFCCGQPLSSPVCAILNRKTGAADRRMLLSGGETCVPNEGPG